MILTIIIVSYNTRDLLDNCLKSIFRQKWQHDIRVLVVDNGSEDGSVRMVKTKYKQVNLIENRENLGFAKANNQALGKVLSDYYLLLNSDTEVLPGSLDTLLNFVNSHHFGIGSCKLLNPDQSFQPNAGDLPFGLALLYWLSGLDDFLVSIKKTPPSFHQKSLSYYQTGAVGWVGGTVMMISQEVVQRIGSLDENIFMYGEDVEYCLRAHLAGIKIGFTREAEVIHIGGGSSSDPKLKQWVGEFKGLLYIYNKYLGLLSKFCIKSLIYLFIIIRVIAYTLTGKINVSKIYLKVLTSI